jgi:hypothetical protein
MLRSSRIAQAMIFQQRTDRIGALVAAILTLASVLLVVILPSDILLSAGNTDMVSEFVSSRAYLTQSLRHVHLPLWNPFTYGGQPFLAVSNQRCSIRQTCSFSA